MILIRKIPSPSAWPFADRKAKSINPFWPTQVHDVRNLHSTSKQVVLGFMAKEVYRCRYWKTRTLVKKVEVVDVNGMYAWSVARWLSKSVNTRVRSVEREEVFGFVERVFEASREAAEGETSAQGTSGGKGGLEEGEGGEPGYQRVGFTLRGRWA